MPTSCPPSPVEAAAPSPPHPAGPDWRLATLAELAAIAMDLTRKLAAAPPEDLPIEKAATAFAKVARAIRHTIALHDRLEHPPAAAAHPRTLAATRLRAKQRSMRDRLVAAIPNDLETREHESLLAEIDDHLDTAYDDPNFALQSPGIIVLEICRDLGLAPNILDFDRDDLLMAGYYDTPPRPDPFSDRATPIYPRPPAPD